MKKRYQILGWYKYSHHPLCQKYESHVFQIHFKKKNKTLYLCQGCTLNAIGWMAGLLTTSIGFIPYVNYQWFHLLIVVGAILGPILFVELLGISNRPIKRIIRIMGGLGLGFFTALIFDFKSDWWYNVMALGILIPSYIAFLTIRKQKRKNKDICEGCKELIEIEENPTKICSGLQEKVAAEKEYSKFASDLLQDDLRKSYLQKYDPVNGEK
jgi:hypothetical protein